MLSKPAWMFFYRFIKPDRYRIIWTSVGFIAVSYLIVPTLLLVKHVFDVSIPEKRLMDFIWVGAAILGLRLINSIATLYLRKLNIDTISNGVFELRKHLTQKIFLFSRSYYTREDLGVLHTQMVQDSERITRMGNAIIASLVPSVLVSLGMMVILLYLNWFLFLIIMAFIPVLFFSNKFMGRIQKKKVYDYQRAFEGYSKGMLFLVKFMELIKTQSVETEESEKHEMVVDDLRNKTTSRTYFNTLNNQVQKLVVGMIGILVLVIGGISVIRGMMTLGDLMAFYLAANQLQSRLNTVSSSFTNLLTGNESMVTLYNISTRKDAEPYTGTRKIKFSGAVSLKNVTFGYGEKPVLRNLDLEIVPGNHLAIIGPNGSGKSTIINLLLGFYKPQEGKLFSDGVAWDEIDFADLRKQLGVVSQHPPLIPGTVSENIAYGNETAIETDIIEVARLSTADAFINQLPKGYRSEIGENGVLLSGGERQKIAIARALLRKPRLLILDEPTNHLAAGHVREIMKNIRMLPYNPAVLIISHDMSVIRHAAEIYMLESGRLQKVDKELLSVE